MVITIILFMTTLANYVEKGHSRRAFIFVTNDFAELITTYTQNKAL